jgi:hypothetical protein
MKSARQELLPAAHQLTIALDSVQLRGSWLANNEVSITTHRGMQRFHAIHEGRMLAPTPK